MIHWSRKYGGGGGGGGGGHRETPLSLNSYRQLIMVIAKQSVYIIVVISIAEFSLLRCLPQGSIYRKFCLGGGAFK